MTGLWKISLTLLLVFFVSVQANATEKSNADEQNTYNPSIAQKNTALLWNRFNDQHGKKWVVEWNNLTGTPHRISGHSIPITEPVTKINIEKISQNILEKFKELLQIDPARLTLSKADLLEPEKFSKSTGTWYVYFTQSYQELPVVGGSVRLIIRDGKLTTFCSDYYPGIRISPKPPVSEDDAAKEAMKDLPQPETRKPVSSRLVIFPQPLSGIIRYRLAWRITMPVIHIERRPVDDLTAVSTPPEKRKGGKEPVQWQYLVDAETGSVISRVNLILNENLAGTVTGMVYPLNPSETQTQVPIGETAVILRQSGSTMRRETDANGRYLFGGLDPGRAGIRADLKGPHVRIFNNETPAADATHTAIARIPGTHDWDWSTDDTSPSDVETNAYHHVKFIREWFQRGVPYNVVPVSNAGPSGDYVEAFVRDGYYCNAFAAIGNGQIFFGSGDQAETCKDHALCSDIIYHEYGHLVIQQMYDDAGVSSVGSMHEAFADYFSMSITNDPILGEVCHLSRNIDTPDTRYPENIVDDTHQAGTIIAGAVWDVRKTLGADYTDSVAFRALKQTPTSFSEYLGAFIEEDDDYAFNPNPAANNDPGDGSPNIEAICHEFFDTHGIYHPYCAGHTDAPVAIITSPSPLEKDDNFIDGSVSELTITGSAQGSLSGHLGHFTLEYMNEKNPRTWLTAGLTLSGGGNSPVDDGALGQWNISGVEDGYYLMRLTVTDTSNKSASVISSVIIDRAVKSGWPRESDRNFVVSPAVTDLDPRYPGLEVIARERWGGIFAWHADGTMVPGWPHLIEQHNLTPPSVADLDDDGTPEVIVAGNEKIHVLHNDGTMMPGWPQTCTEGDHIALPPVISDLDNDGKYEVVAATTNGTICVWRRDGTPVSGWPRSMNGEIRMEIAAGDLDSDGHLEIVVAVDNRIYALRNNGMAIPGWPQTFGIARQGAAPVLGDVDRDGSAEILVAGPEDIIYAWRYDGTPVSGWPLYFDQYPYGTTSLADLNQDGYPEVVHAGPHINVWRHDGNSLAWAPYKFNCFSFGCSSSNLPWVGDIDGDGRMEIIPMVTSEIGSTQAQFEELGKRRVKKIIAINEDGSITPDWQEYPRIRYSAHHLITDIDQDGKTEIVTGGSGVTVWDTPFTYSSSSLEWPEYRHDSRRTGMYLPRMPDLAIASLTRTPSNPTTADQVVITAGVRNIGTEAAGPSTIGLKIGGETLPRTYPVPTLMPGQTHSIQRKEILGVARNYLVTATADINSNVLESDEANNVRKLSLPITNAPDLVVEFSRTTDPTIFDSVTITASVKNIGSGTAGPSTALFEAEGMRSRKMAPVPSLAPGRTHTVARVKLKKAPRPPRTYSVTATADINNDVHESDETNNAKTYRYP